MDDSTATPKLQPISNKHARTNPSNTNANDAVTGGGGGDGANTTGGTTDGTTGGVDSAGDFVSSYRGRNYDPNYQKNYRNYDTKKYYQDNFKNNRYLDRSTCNQDYKNNKRKNAPDDQYKNSSRWHNLGFFRSGYNAYNNNTNNFCQIPATNLEDCESSTEKSPNHQINIPVWVQAKAAKRAQAEKTSISLKSSINDESIIEPKEVSPKNSPNHLKDSVKQGPILIKKVFVVKDSKLPPKKIAKLSIKDQIKLPQQKPTNKNLLKSEQTNSTIKTYSKGQTKSQGNKKLLNLGNTNLTSKESQSNSSDSLNNIPKVVPKAPVEKSLIQSKNELNNLAKADPKSSVKISLNLIKVCSKKLSKTIPPPVEKSPIQSKNSKSVPSATVKSTIQSKDSSINIHEAVHKSIAKKCSKDLNKKSLTFKNVLIVKKCVVAPKTKTKKQNNTPKTLSNQKCPNKKQQKNIVDFKPSAETAVKDNSSKSPSSSTDKVDESLQKTEELIELRIAPSIPTEVVNSESDSPVQTEAKCPKISLIPLSRLIRNELLELTEDNLNSVVSSTTSTHPDFFNTTPSKLICRPNLVRRRQRNISSCSNSSNPTETIVEKVANMDKIGIKNVINNSGTKYDEALKLQARKRLREEIRKQLKSMNVEQPKDSANAEFIPDDIVDAIHIPDVVLDEIRKAFGIEFINANSMKLHVGEINNRNTENQLCTNQTDNISDNSNIYVNQRKETNPQSETSITSTCISKKPTTDLMSRLRNAEYIKSPTEASIPKEHPQFRFADECSPTTPNLSRSLQLSDRRRSTTPDKTQAPRKTGSTISRRRRSSEVIVILSSSSSSNSSSSSSSSSSDSDSDSSAHSVASSVKRLKQKQKVYAENVVESFEKLILPSISENLAKRYHAKYSNSINTKLHFISCICVSGYNSEKFSKIEIAKVQRNLKSNDSTNALEFLMREIVNVFNKQKQIAKDKDEITNQKNSNLIKPHESKTPTENTPPDSSKRDDNDDADCNRIEAAATPQTDTAAAAIKSKSVDAAEKVTADENVEKYKSMLLRLSRRNREKKSLSTAVVAQQSTPLPSEHQSVNEPTLNKVGVGNKSAGNAKIQKTCIDKSKLDASKTYDETNENDADKLTNCINTSEAQSNCQADNDNNINDKDSDIDAQLQSKWKSAADEIKQPLDMKTSKLATPFLGIEFTSCSNYSGLESLFSNISGGSGTSAISAMIQHPSFPTVDLDMLKQQSMFGEIIVSNLRDIDVKLMELHKRKMFIEEMLLKLQKEKMDADLQTIKLQNEKFILLNTAMTANATATAAKVEPNVAAVPAAELKSEGTNTEAEEPTIIPDAKWKITRSRRKNREDDDDKNTTAKVASKTTKVKNLIAESKDPAPRVKRKYTKRGEMQRTMLAKRKRSVPVAEVISSDDDTSTVLPVLDDMYLQTPARNDNAHVDLIETSNYAELPCGNLEGIKSPITQIRIFENFIVAAAEDGSLYKFNVRTLELENQFAKHSEAITQMYLCRKKKILYTTSLDGYLKKTSIENFELDIQSLYLQEPLQSIDVQWGVAYVGSRWGNIFTYDIAANNLADTMFCSLEASIIAIKATKEGPRKILVVSSKGNMIQFRDATSGLLLRTLDVPEHLHIYSLLLDYGYIYCGTQRNEIYKFDFTTGVRKSILNCGNGAVSMQFYKNKFILVGCYDGLIYVLDKETGDQIAQITGSGKMVLTLELAGDKIITSAKDNTMKVIDIPSHVVALTTT